MGITSPNISISSIQGTSSISFRDVTPLSMLYTEYIAMAVRADSPIRSAGDLIERLKRDPQSVSLVFSTTLGNNNHLAVARIAKAAGVDIKRLKVIAFKSGAAHVTAVLGGHADVSVTGPANFVAHKQAGAMRVLAVTAAQRLSGEFADVPTWRELGIDVVDSNGRYFLGPKGLTPEQISWWDKAFSRVARDEKFRRTIEAGHASITATTSKETMDMLAKLDREYRSLLTELGFTRGNRKKNP